MHVVCIHVCVCVSPGAESVVFKLEHASESLEGLRVAGSTLVSVQQISGVGPRTFTFYKFPDCTDAAAGLGTSLRKPRPL